MIVSSMILITTSASVKTGVRSREIFFFNVTKIRNSATNMGDERYHCLEAINYLISQEGEIIFNHKLNRPRCNKNTLSKYVMFKTIPEWNNLFGNILLRYIFAATGWNLNWPSGPSRVVFR